jgi:hypothetical protein
MYKRIVPFNTRAFANKKVKPVNNFSFASGNHVVSLMVNEFNRAAGTYPIVFLKEQEDQLSPFALLGFQQGENLFVDADGQWKAGYIPAVIRRYPFALGKGKEENQFMLCIDDESEFLSETEGQPLVQEDGSPGEIVEKAKEYLSELHRSGEITRRFARELSDRELLRPLNMKVQGGEKTLNVGGCFCVDEKKLAELPDEDFLALRKVGALPLVYAHLVSLGQMERLARLQGEQTAA